MLYSVFCFVTSVLMVSNVFTSVISVYLILCHAIFRLLSDYRYVVFSIQQTIIATERDSVATPCRSNDASCLNLVPVYSAVPVWSWRAGQRRCDPARWSAAAIPGARPRAASGLLGAGFAVRTRVPSSGPARLAWPGSALWVPAGGSGRRGRLPCTSHFPPVLTSFPHTC